MVSSNHPGSIAFVFQPDAWWHRLNSCINSSLSWDLVEAVVEVGAQTPPDRNSSQYVMV